MGILFDILRNKSNLQVFGSIHLIFTEIKGREKQTDGQQSYPNF